MISQSNAETISCRQKLLVYKNYLHAETNYMQLKLLTETDCMRKRSASNIAFYCFLYKKDYNIHKKQLYPSNTQYFRKNRKIILSLTDL
jgi:hypothetical protein